MNVPLPRPPSTIEEVSRSYSARGFALAALPIAEGDPVATLLTFGDHLGLGRPFVPALYAATTSYATAGVNVISAQPAAGEHPAFEGRGAVELHTDGTLEPPGRVRTSMLLCVEQSDDGGETVLFDVVSAFRSLLRSHPTLAHPLMDPRALTRRTTIGVEPLASCGPVLARLSDRWVSRFSVTPRDDWAFDQVPSLSEARAALEALAEPGSPFVTRLKLRPGQCLVMANDRVAHGRAPFQDGRGLRRKLIRALYESAPRTRPSSPRGGC
jgi:hypothetical protein